MCDKGRGKKKRKKKKERGKRGNGGSERLKNHKLRCREARVGGLEGWGRRKWGWGMEGRRRFDRRNIGEIGVSAQP